MGWLLESKHQEQPQSCRRCAALLQVRIVKEDGAIGLFRGAGPTVVRAMALNMGMLASNDEVHLRRLSLSCMGSA